MSYYEKNKYTVSTHSAYRIKQRLNVVSKSDLELNNFVNQIISSNLGDTFETPKTLYVNTNINNVYLVIDKINSLVITATPISYERQLKILEEEL